MIREGVLGERFQENESRAGCGGGGEVEVWRVGRAMEKTPNAGVEACGWRFLWLRTFFSALSTSIFNIHGTRFKEATHIY